MTDSILSADAMRDRIRAAVNEAGSQKAYAAAIGISTAALCQVLSGKREPNEALLAAIGLARVTAFRAI